PGRPLGARADRSHGRGPGHRRAPPGARPGLTAPRAAAPPDDAGVCRYSVTPWSRSSFQTLAGVMGMSTWRTPRCHSASTTALAIAAGAPTVADSPTPLAPSGWCGEGVQVLSVSQFGVSTAVGTR